MAKPQTKKGSASKPRAAKTSKPKQTLKSKPLKDAAKATVDSDVDVLAEFDSDEVLEASGAELSSDDRQFLGRVSRFLIAILGPRFIRRAVKNNYAGSEHNLGWRLWNTAAGRDRPFEHNFTEATVDLEKVDPVRFDKLRRLDDIENRFFPRARMVIQRFVPKKNRGAFEAAFFKDLAQQPLGPLVVDSVKTFLSRVEALETSKEPGAVAVFNNLRLRGLTPLLVAEAKGLIEELTEPGSLPAISPVASEVAAAHQAQLDALEELHLWWNDWATTLRPSFNVQEQIVLGLTEVKVAPKKDPNGSSGTPTTPTS
ncbi:MAG: hypothetical protein U0271_36825 [Polyangiaceae bacterium]